MVEATQRKKGVRRTPRQARGGDATKDTLVMLLSGFALFAIAAGVLIWYFGVWPFHHAPTGIAG